MWEIPTGSVSACREAGVRQPGQWCTRRSKADAAHTHTRGAHGGKVREA